ncbi:MAG TPA: TonB-dependent receptor [Gemmatimonadota bacterium]|jgi:iron complex outermembrane receptor protein
MRGFIRTAALAALIGAAAAALGAQETATLRGRVLDPAGNPVSDAAVRIEGTLLGVLTGPDGAWEIAGVPAGPQRVVAERLGYHAVETTVEAPSAAPLELVLVPHPVRMAEVTVIGTPEELAETRERMRQVPGSVALVEPEEIRSTRQANLPDVLRFVPGVYAQPRFGAADETQLSVRGSGLRNNFHLRGVNVLVNGMPYRNADGFTDFESLELLTTEAIQVYKGANALRFGGSTLGGAINLETKTGYTAQPVNAFAQGGSFGFFKGQLSSGDAFDGFDYYGSYARTTLDGFREFSGQRRHRLNGHAGYRISPQVDLRAFYFFADVAEDLPGSLTLEELEEDPRQAVAGNVADRWGRDYVLHHLGVQLRSQLSPTQRVELAPYVQYRDIDHPIFRVIAQISRDVGAELRYENTGALGGLGNRLTVGLQGAYGDVKNRQFENEGGEHGALAKDQLDEASTVAVYAEDVLEVAPRLSAVLGLRWDRSTRRAEDRFLADGDQSDERTFEEWMPKVGFLYETGPADGEEPPAQIYGNASRSFEPPLLLELNSLTVPGFIDLEGQEAWQFELGVRGRRGGVGWDVTAYDVELEDEILNVNVQPFPDAPFTVPTYRNAPRTRHYGLEAGLDATLPGRVLTDRGGGDRVGVRLAYTFARHTFEDDELFDGNEIPGLPEHVLQLEAEYRHPAGVSVAPNVEWVPSDYFVDSANTVENDGWTVFGVRGEWELPAHGVTAFAAVRNLTDEVYSPAVTVDDAAGRFFLPADGRSFYGGIRWTP